MSWPYEKLAPYECLVSEEFGEQYSISAGDEIVLTFSTSSFWSDLLRVQYNEAARENGWNFFPEYTWTNKTTYTYAGISQINCTVKDVLSETYGKMPEIDAET